MKICRTRPASDHHNDDITKADGIESTKPLHHKVKTTPALRATMPFREYRSAPFSIEDANSPTPRTPECSERPSSPEASPSMLKIDLELDRTLALLDGFEIDASGIGGGNYRRRKKTPRAIGRSSPLRLSNLFNRSSDRQRSPLSAQYGKKPFVKIDQLKKTDSALSAAVSVVRARPRAVLKSADPSPPRPLGKSRTAYCTQRPRAYSTVGTRSNRVDIEFQPDKDQCKTPITRPAKLGNVVELSRVSTSLDLNGTRVARSHQSNISMISPDGTRSPKYSVTSTKNRAAAATSVANMMKNIKSKMPNRSESEEDDDESDSSTIHLLKIDDLAHSYVCEYNSQERTDDPGVPPTLTITTSKMTTTSILGASAASFMGDDFFGVNDDVVPPAPVMRETKSCSSVHTLKWKSYNKYYDSPRSTPKLQKGSSLGSESRSRVDSGGSVKLSPSLLVPPLETQAPIPPISSPAVGKLEVAAGHSVDIRGADETLIYVAADATSEKSLIATEQCMACTSTVHCVWDAAFMLCPVCLTIQPTESEETKGQGVGLGFLPADWESWKTALALQQQS